MLDFLCSLSFGSLEKENCRFTILPKVAASGLVTEPCCESVVLTVENRLKGSLAL